MLDWQGLADEAREILDALPGRQVTLVKLAPAPDSS
jgi:ethanolamine utilization microcompartment shell protein EutS